jgi:hypothetical protein
VRADNLNGHCSNQQNSTARTGVLRLRKEAQLITDVRRLRAVPGCHHARKGVQGTMQRFLQLHALAATRGDGLRPELRNLLERFAEAQRATSSVAIIDDCHLANAIDSSSRMTLTRGAFGEFDPQPWKA